MTVKQLGKLMVRLKNKRKWGWERLCREMHTVMGCEGPAHTTLYRYASGETNNPNVLILRWVEEALRRLKDEV